MPASRTPSTPVVWSALTAQPNSHGIDSRMTCAAASMTSASTMRARRP
jgi:hypothetical protein